jgi:hypothetical protein
MALPKREAVQGSRHRHRAASVPVWMALPEREAAQGCRTRCVAAYRPERHRPEAPGPARG